jgi:hypothetical protein
LFDIENTNVVILRARVTHFRLLRTGITPTLGFSNYYNLSGRRIHCSAYILFRFSIATNNSDVTTFLEENPAQFIAVWLVWRAASDGDERACAGGAATA